MITILLHGQLAFKFIPKFKAVVGSVQEAIEALKANFDGFQTYLLDAARYGLHYRICVNGQELEEWMLKSPLPDGATISIAPVPKGAGNTFRIIAGVALIGLGIAGVAFLGFTSSTLVITGIALLLGGLRGQVKAPTKDKPSLMFNGPQTTNQEGGRVQIAYGIILVGWILVSAKIRTAYAVNR